MEIEPVQIFFTEIEVEMIIEELEEEIKELEEYIQKSVTAKNTYDRVLSGKPHTNNRKEKLEEIKKQPLWLESKARIDTNLPLLHLDLKDKTFSDNSTGMQSSLIFLTSRFKSGHFLGFWSGNPCSTTRDQDKGWAVVDPVTLKIIDECETCSGGIWVGEFLDWQKTLKPTYGKMTILHDGIDTNKPSWKNDE